MGTRVSIIIPVFRTPFPFLDECLSCIKRQTYPHSDLEVVIFDEASPPHYETGLLDRIKQIDEILILRGCRKSRKGLRYSRNDAIRMSSGDWILLLDSDDILHPLAITKCVENIRNGIDFIYSNHIKMSSDMSAIEQVRNKQIYQIWLNHFKGTAYDPFLHATFVFHLQMFRRSCFDTLGGFRENLGDGEEVDFHIRVSELSESNNFALIPQTLYYYRNNPWGACNEPRRYRRLIQNISEMITQAARRRKLDVDKAIRIGRAKPTNAAHYALYASDKQVFRLPFFDYETLTLDEYHLLNGVKEGYLTE